MSRVAPTTARSQDNPTGLRSNGRKLIAYNQSSISLGAYQYVAPQFLRKDSQKLLHQNRRRSS